jgi:hypothetical protein
MKSDKILLVMLGLTLSNAGCESSSSTTDAGADHQSHNGGKAALTGKDAADDSVDDSAKTQRKREKLARDIEIARHKLRKEQLAAQQKNAKDERKIAELTIERDLTVKKLEQFVSSDSKTRLAKARLDLQRAVDGVAESEEELEQLEIMYSEDDLGDKTKEIVLQRGRRRLSRAQENLRIQTAELETLESRSLPLEQEKLELEVAKARTALAEAQRDVEMHEIESSISIMSAEAEILKLEGELEDLKKDVSP